VAILTDATFKAILTATIESLLLFRQLSQRQGGRESQSKRRKAR